MWKPTRNWSSTAAWNPNGFAPWPSWASTPACCRTKPATPEGGQIITNISLLPRTLQSLDTISTRLNDRLPALFLDYDGTLTPIVERPELAVISPHMRHAVQRLASLLPLAIVSGRDRKDVEKLVGIEGVIYAGGHGFDIWAGDGRDLGPDLGPDFRPLLAEAEAWLRRELDPVAGVLLEPKRASVAVHYRLAAETEHNRVRDVVEAILTRHPDQLKVTPGRMVYEIQPNIDWHKGRAVLHLIEALGLNEKRFLPFYLGDDRTDEDAFAAIQDIGIGIFVGHPDDPELAGRTTAAQYLCRDQEEVASFLDWVYGLSGTKASA